METTKIMPCPCGGDGLIKPMPELKPITLLFDNSANGNNRLFGVVLDSLTVIPPTTVNNDSKAIVQPFLKMLLFFPIQIWKIDIQTDNINQLNKPLFFSAFNHNFKTKIREVLLNDTIANTQVNALMRSIQLDYTMKPNTGFALVVLANSKTWITLHPKQVVTS